MANRPENYPDITATIHAQGMRFLFVNEGESPINDAATVTQLRAAVTDYRRRNGFPANVGSLCCPCIESYGIKCRQCECPKAALQIMCDGVCGDSCQNKAFGGEWQVVGLIVKSEGAEEFLVADERIPSGTWIDEFTGQLKAGVPDVSNKHAYPISIPGIGQYYVDASKVGGRCHYISHSNRPNCKVIARIVGDLVKLFIIAQAPIQKGERITLRFQQCMVQEFESRMSVSPD